MHETEQIYQWLKMAKSLVITAGAGIGVDSGLSDYRGSGGQWGKVETENEKSVFDVVNPKLFLENPEYGWKLFASRLVEYTNATPHEGFKIILDLIDKFSLDYFVLTSNVDNQFQKAGFDQSRIRELHGCVFYLQCSLPCSDKIWEHQLDLNTIQAEIVNGKFPTCPVCGNISRPNVYMFRDNTFLPHRTNNQELKFLEFLEKNKNDEPFDLLITGTFRQSTLDFIGIVDRVRQIDPYVLCALYTNDISASLLAESRGLKLDDYILKKNGPHADLKPLFDRLEGAK